LDVSETNEENVVSVLNVFSVMISSWSETFDTQWPNFTLPDFEGFGLGTRFLSGAVLIAFSPLIKHEDRAGWEAYSVENQQWIADGLKFALPGEVSEIPGEVRDIPGFVYRKMGRSYFPEVEMEQYSPVWQMSPPPPDTSIVNFNLFNNPTFERLVNVTRSTRQAALSEVLDTSELFGAAVPEEDGHPHSMIVLPVFRQAFNPFSEIVGHVLAVIPWFEFFENILAESSTSGVYAVVEDSCGKSFTYFIESQNVTFLGFGDSHDSKYDYLKHSTEFVANIENLVPGISGLTDQCEYKLSVYPSAQYEEGYTSSAPIYFTVGVLCVFVWVAAVFSFYDCLVQRRQEKVNTVATKSNAIVNSLFPAQVRDKLIMEQTEPRKRYKMGGNASVAASSATNEKKDAWGNQMHAVGGGGIDDDSPPIADLFPSATVGFLDIAGFTAWSSQREPSQVFILLETIYRSFDKIAQKRKVFKVETIGDCYVAGGCDGLFLI
jgi:hypothetical protein